MQTLLCNDIFSLLSDEDQAKSLLDALKNLKEIHVQGLEGSTAAVYLRFLQDKLGVPFLVITPGESEAQGFIQDWEALSGECGFFPGWGTLMYQDVSPHPRLFGQRSRTLMMLRDGLSVVVSPMRGVLSRLPAPKTFDLLVMKFARGKNLNVSGLAERLSGLGYERTPRVTVPGEFALRGEVLDIFPAGEDEAIRVVFEFDTVEEIRYFNPISQNSSDVLEEFRLAPMREHFFTPQEALKLAELLDTKSAENFQATGHFRNEELYYSLGSPVTLTEYFSEKPLIVWLGWERLAASEDGFFKELEFARDEAFKEGRERPLVKEVVHRIGDIKSGNTLISHNLADDILPLPLRFLSPTRNYHGEVQRFQQEAEDRLASGWSVSVFAESEQQAKRLEQILRNPQIRVYPHGLSGGLEFEGVKFFAVHESEIFGRKRKRPESLRHVHAQAIDSFVDLSPGDLVVHVNYGVGRFLGIDRIKAGGTERDYIKLEYAGEETVFIPIEQVNLVQRYIGNEGREPKLDSLGGKTWEKKKTRVKKAVEDLADRLTVLYARRRAATGFRFPQDNEWQLSFEADFPFEETEDQLLALVDIKADMESERPMDRLLCGDVGFGKTEVALRAAFKAVTGGKQVAFLAPTTILAEQHYETCLERFRRFPVRIAMLSRFVDRSKQKKILDELESGEIDFLIGTHRILQKDIVYKNLGLLVVDEEQRFGVKDKERLKEMRASIDALAMSATPIPRTLHMSLLRIRDMSLLKTPPRNRHPIETVIQEFEPGVIQKAIRRELQRDGQVFYLHNRIEGLDEVRLFLQTLLPEVLIETAHGQLPPHELEDIMHRFIHGAFQVLVSTTIIENGIDIPNVNTIIIDRADMYGISQLYQLRGRVGRSGRMAHAYLLYPQKRALTELAMKRLQVISDFTELGSGFKIAMKDLEVRGAGNLLGGEQSGEIASVGFDMYLRLLDEAVAERLGEGSEKNYEIVLELDYSGFIPDFYISEPMEKMEVYKAIASVSESADLSRVKEFITDRFGPMPEAVASLMGLAEIRVLARGLKIQLLREKLGFCRIEFQSVSDLPFEKIMKLIQKDPEAVRPLPDDPKALLIQTTNISLEEKPAFIKEKLEGLLHG